VYDDFDAHLDDFFKVAGNERWLLDVECETDGAGSCVGVRSSRFMAWSQMAISMTSGEIEEVWIGLNAAGDKFGVDGMVYAEGERANRASLLEDSRNEVREMANLNALRSEQSSSTQPPTPTCTRTLFRTWV